MKIKNLFVISILNDFQIAYHLVKNFTKIKKKSPLIFMKGDFKRIKANKINILGFAFLTVDCLIVQPLAKEVINASLATFDLN